MPNLEVLQIQSSALREVRTVWLGRSLASNPSRCLVFLDAELYLQRVEAERILNRLVEQGQLEDVTRVYLSYGEPADRHIDFICSSTFSRFVVEEFLPWIKRITHSHDQVILVGLSLSGLAAIFAAIQYPGLFAGIISQSPSAWWNDEWIVSELAGADVGVLPIWLSVGTDETEVNVRHSPSLFQKTSQIDSCNRLAKVLGETGQVHFELFTGGHDSASWAKDLTRALGWLVDSVSPGGFR